MIQSIKQIWFRQKAEVIKSMLILYFRANTPQVDIAARYLRLCTVSFCQEQKYCYASNIPKNLYKSLRLRAVIKNKELEIKNSY